MFVRGKALVNMDLKERGCEVPAVRLVEQLGMQHQVMFSGFDVHSLKMIKNPMVFRILTLRSSMENMFFMV